MSGTSNPFSLSGKTILVTGAAGGIGNAVAYHCSRLGARLVLTDIDENGLKTVTASLEGSSIGPHLAFRADLTKETDLQFLVDSCPVLDGFVCNAGVMKLVLTQFLTESEIDRIHKINLVAPMLLTRSLLRLKKFKRGSSLVFTASAAGVYRVSIGNGIYATTKCGIDAFMRTVALELGHKGIRCNSVNPGMVETNLINSGQFTQEEKEREMKNYPLGRFAKPEDVALGVIYLLSDASSFVTGTALKIDGGMTLS